MGFSDSRSILLELDLASTADLSALLGAAIPELTAVGARSVRVRLGPGVAKSRLSAALETPHPWNQRDARASGRRRAPLRLSLLGVAKRKRLEIRVGREVAHLTPSSFHILASLCLGRMRDAAGWVHKVDLGATDDQGWRGVSRLRSELLPAVPSDLETVENDGNGMYRLGDDLEVGDVDLDALARIECARMRALVLGMRAVRG